LTDVAEKRMLIAASVLIQCRIVGDISTMWQKATSSCCCCCSDSARMRPSSWLSVAGARLLTLSVCARSTRWRYVYGHNCNDN